MKPGIQGSNGSADIGSLNLDLAADDAAIIDTHSCDSEPIHVPGRIQSHGFLIALTNDWQAAYVSENIGDFTGIDQSSWFQQPLKTLIDKEALHILRNQVAMLSGPDDIQRSFGVQLIDGQSLFDCALHRTADLIILEAERAVVDEREAAGLVRAMVARLKHSEGLEAFFGDAAQHVQALTRFDRVMVYKFDSHGHGEVIAESLNGVCESYLGLHYPASDIPAQARVLYLRNPFRIIADVESDTVAIARAPLQPATHKLDQSLSMLRAVSPIHIEYLENMGVAASLSISIIVNGKLWGLFACHHNTARLPCFAYRTAAELFGEMFSMMLERRLQQAAMEHELRDRAAAELLIAEMEHDEHLLAKPQRLGELLFDTIAADGLCVCQNKNRVVWGSTPKPEVCEAIIAKLSGRTTHRGFATDALSVFLPGADCSGAAGFLAIPLMRQPDDYILLFRREHVRTVKWAGEPVNGGSQDGQSGRIAPRESFAAWSQMVKGTCEPFSAADEHAAETIRIALLEAQLRLVAFTGKSDNAPQNGDDLLIAELNHRVRNILALVRGLISQTKGNAETAEGFITSLDERVQALARAHDQITRDRWNPSRLYDLIATEADAYSVAGHERVELHGPNVLVQPQAFTTLALVFHEMMTNAAKYGALSTDGTVRIDWLLDARGDLKIQWRELGGPAVAPPLRRGFGSTIIEQSIPHDLGGTTTIEYLQSGLQAAFCVPARHLAGLSGEDAPSPRKPKLNKEFRLLEGLNVLLVEDNMIIAMSCVQMLNAQGAASIKTAANVADALAYIAAQDFDLALLDFNLGSETSIEIADELLKRRIPFAFATGFDGDIQTNGHANAPVMGKPYGLEQLVPLLLNLGFDTSASGHA